jgi:hypothetical protein
MTNRLKVMTLHVRLRVQCWWLNWEVDRIGGRIYKGLAWHAVPTDYEHRFRVN